MPEKKNSKLPLLIVGILVTVLLIGLVIFFSIKLIEKQNEINKLETYANENNNFIVKTYNDKEYYITNGNYKGEYDLQIIDSLKDNTNNFSNSTIMSYSEYVEFCKNWNLSQKYKSSDQNYLVFSYSKRGPVSAKVVFSGIDIKNNYATLYIWDNFYGTVASTIGYVIVVPTNENITNINTKTLITKEDYNKMVGNNPLEGYTYTVDDYKKIAEPCYINTSNNDLNNIINNMIDAMTKQHTIQINTDKKTWYQEPEVTYIDLINSIVKEEHDNEFFTYTTYTDENKTTYMIENNTVSTDNFHETREHILYDMFHDENLKLIVNANKDSFNVNRAKVSDGGENYVVVYDYNNQGEEVYKETYYINKTTYLLEKTTLENNYFFYTNSHIYSYSDESIELPKVIYSNIKSEN